MEKPTCPKCKRKMTYKIIYNNQTNDWNDYYVCVKCWFKLPKSEVVK